MTGTDTWFVDCEWGFRAGRDSYESAFEPVVFCAVGCRSGERRHFWGRDGRLRQFIKNNSSDTFVSHNNVAEMKYLLRLGIDLPQRWFDTYVAWRRLNNRPGRPEASLTAALGQLGLPHLPLLDKQQWQQKILRLEFDAGSDRDSREIIDYCFYDCDGCAEVYQRIAGKVDPAAMEIWTEYLKAISRTELRGIPFDMPTARTIIHSREAIVEHLIGLVNKTYPVYVGMTFRRRAFLEWCAKQGISWPWTWSKITGIPMQSLTDDAMKLMETRHPFINLVRQVRKTVRAFNRLSIKADGRRERHYFSTWPFRSLTGRNQPRNYVFGGPKWMRWMILPESPEHVLAYLDCVAQEIGIVAFLSGDQSMQRMYQTEDPHMTFAIMAKAAPEGSNKSSHPLIRKQYKTVNLGVIYGQTEFGISDRLGISLDEARELLGQHQSLFSRYWAWSRRVVQAAYRRAEIRTPCGWGAAVPGDSKHRTWLNFPAQAAGGDIMRLVVIYLDRQGVRLLAPVHDGFLLSCRRNQLDDLRAAVDLACEKAAEQVLGGHRLKWSLDIFEDRYRDEDGEPLWRLICEALKELYPGHVIDPSR